MFNSTKPSKTLKQFIGRLVFVSVLLTSVSALTVSSGAAANDAGSSGLTKSSNAQTSTSQRVFKDDFEKHLVPVSQPRPTKMIWLGQKEQAQQQKTSQSRLIWLRQNKRSD